MKKYILSTVAALCIGLCPAVAQETGNGDQEQTVATYSCTINDAGDAYIITETTIDKESKEAVRKSVEVDTATYNAYQKKGFKDDKIFKNQNISDSDNSGMGVTLMSMCIVLFALIVLSILFMFFGKLFAKNQSKKKSEAHGEAAVIDEDDHDSGEVIAAIALALDEHFNSKHDLEDTVLTIRRMKRAYSPWNSKIYNMREVPTLRKR